MTPQQQATKLAQRYKQIEIDFNRANKFVRIKLLAEITDIANQMFSIGYSLPKLIAKRQLRELQNANDQSIKNPSPKINKCNR